MGLHSGKERVITVVQRIGESHIDILLEQIKRSLVVVLVLCKHDTEQKPIRAVQIKQVIYRGVSVYEATGSGKVFFFAVKQ